MNRPLAFVCCTLLASSAAVMGADIAPAIKPATTPPTASDDSKNAKKPYLGVKIDESAFDATNGLPVEQVVPGSTAADMGILRGDRLLTFNGQKLTSKDDLAKRLGDVKVGDEIELTVTRTGEAQPLIKKGTLTERLKQETIWNGLQKTREDISKINKALGETGKPRLSLPEILDRLKAIEEALPGAVDDFKKTYPNGRFSFSLHIDITSDETAKSPITVSNQTSADTGANATNTGGSAPAPKK